MSAKQYRTIADLVHEISNEDVNGMGSREYALWCKEVETVTTPEERHHFYMTGDLPDGLWRAIGPHAPVVKQARAADRRS